MLNTRFFGQMDAVIKDFLMPVMLGKQRSQMNQSLCYDVNRIMEWRHLMVCFRTLSQPLFFRLLVSCVVIVCS